MLVAKSASVARQAAGRIGTICLLLGMAIWFFLDVGPRAANTGPSHRTDLTVYTTAGAAFFDGNNPYEVASPRGWHYLYPPLFGIVCAPLSALDYWWQACVWFAVSVVLCCGCFFECRKILRELMSRSQISGRQKNKLTVVAALTWLFAVLPIVNTLQRGQVGIAVLYPLLLGLRFTLEAAGSRIENPRSASAGSGKTFCAGILLAIPVVIKLTPILPVGFFVLQSIANAFYRRPLKASYRSALCTGGGVFAGLMLFLFIVPAAAVGVRANWQHLQTWNQRVVSSQNVGAQNSFNAQSPRNQSFSNATFLAGTELLNIESETTDGQALSRALKPFTLAIRVALIFGLLFVGLKRNAVENAFTRAAMFGLSCQLTLIVSPLSWGHHYTLMIPSVFLMGIWLVEQRVRFAVVLSALPAVLCVAHYVSLEGAGIPGILGLGTVVTFAMSLGIVLTVIGRDAAETHLPFESVKPQSAPIEKRAA